MRSARYWFIYCVRRLVVGLRCCFIYPVAGYRAAFVTRSFPLPRSLLPPPLPRFGLRLRYVLPHVRSTLLPGLIRSLPLLLVRYLPTHTTPRALLRLVVVIWFVRCLLFLGLFFSYSYPFTLDYVGSFLPTPVPYRLLRLIIPLYGSQLIVDVAFNFPFCVAQPASSPFVDSVWFVPTALRLFYLLVVVGLLLRLFLHSRFPFRYFTPTCLYRAAPHFTPVYYGLRYPVVTLVGLVCSPHG